MENSNFISLSLDINSATGIKVLCAIATAVSGTDSPLKEAVKKAAPKVAPAVEQVAEDVAQVSGETTPAPKVATTAKAPVAKAATPAPAAKAAAAPVAKAAAPAKAAKPAAVAFEDLEQDAQLEALKQYVSRFTKKGKSMDIKSLLAPFGAGKVSELEVESYGDFNAAMDRYAGGESVADIFPDMD